LLWCSQGAATAETLSWLYASGADFRLVNDNGHSALHKAAQRGNTSACKWLVDMFLHEEQEDFDGFLLIGPDAEGACPSDLCGMNGHEILAEWIAKQECDYVRRHLNAYEPSLKCRKLLNSTALPTWLKDSAAFDGTQNLEPADGIGRMKYVLLANTRDVDLRQCERTKQRVERNGNLNEID
jgi:ankyrin repeat protein